MTRRNFWSVALAAGTLILAAGPTLAQGQGGGGGRGPGGFGFGGRGFGGPAGLLRMPEVQKELKLDQAQIELLQSIGRPAPGAFEGLRDLSPEERRKRFEAMQAQQEKQIAEVLDAKQMSRLKQLQLQQDGARAIARKDVADTLKLSPDQRQKIEAAIQGEQEAMRAAFQGFQPGGEQPSQEARQAAFQKMRDTRTATDAKLTAILTPAQKTQFDGMKGAPFTFPAPQFGPGGRGGFGGRGGRPGGGNN